MSKKNQQLAAFNEENSEPLPVMEPAPEVSDDEETAVPAEEKKEDEKVVEMKMEKRTLRYDFTAQEVYDFSMQLAQETKKVQSLEDEKKSVVSHYAAKINEAKATCNKLSNFISDGWEFREIECEVHYHQPEKGKKTLVRKDNNRAIVEKMEPWEWNLFNQPEEELTETL